MKFHTIYIVIIISILSACQKDEYLAPKGIPDKEEMSNILYDIHLASAIANSYNVIRNQEKINLYSDSLYADVLKKHNISDSILTASILYYSSQYKDYEKMYENTIEKIQLELTRENRIDSIYQARVKIDLDIRRNQNKLIELMRKHKD